MTKTRAEAEAWLLAGEPVSGALAWDRSSLDYVTLPCGLRVPDMASQRTIEILKAEPNWCGLEAFKEYGYAVRYEIAEHAEHSAGQCAGLKSKR